MRILRLHTFVVFIFSCLAPAAGRNLTKQGKRVLKFLKILLVIAICTTLKIDCVISAKNHVQ